MCSQLPASILWFAPGAHEFLEFALFVYSQTACNFDMSTGHHFLTWQIAPLALGARCTSPQIAKAALYHQCFWFYCVPCLVALHAFLLLATHLMIGIGLTIPIVLVAILVGRDVIDNVRFRRFSASVSTEAPYPRRKLCDGVTHHTGLQFGTCFGKPTSQIIKINRFSWEPDALLCSRSGSGSRTKTDHRKSICQGHQSCQNERNHHFWRLWPWPVHHDPAKLISLRHCHLPDFITIHPKLFELSRSHHCIWRAADGVLWATESRRWAAGGFTINYNMIVVYFPRLRWIHARFRQIHPRFRQIHPC